MADAAAVSRRRPCGLRPSLPRRRLHHRSDVKSRIARCRHSLHPRTLQTKPRRFWHHDRFSGGGPRSFCMDHLSPARKYELRPFVREWKAAHRQRRESETARQKDDDQESAVPGPEESISPGRCLAGRSRWKNLAQLANGIRWWNPVCGRVSIDQRMPRLRSWRPRHLYLEFRYPGKIPWNIIPRDDSGTLAVTRKYWHQILIFCGQASRGRIPWVPRQPRK